MKPISIFALFHVFISASSWAAGTGFSYTEATAAFKAAVAPTTDQLNGGWKMVGVAVPGTDPDRYDTAGIANADGSLYDELRFSVQQDVLGGSSTLVLNVLGLGNSSTNQGPYSVKASATGLAFQTYGYTNDCEDTSISFPRTCKIVAASGALICHEDDSASGAVDYADEYDVYLRE